MNTFKEFAIASTLLAMGLFAMAAANAEIAVIVHPANTNNLSEKDISRIFLGSLTQYPDGTDAIPIDQDKDKPGYTQFVKEILKKNEQQVKQYWAQQLFSGKGTPPREMGSSKNVKKLVSENPALIGYINAQDVDTTVRVIYRH